MVKIMHKIIDGGCGEKDTYLCTNKGIDFGAKDTAYSWGVVTCKDCLKKRKVKK